MMKSVMLMKNKNEISWNAFNWYVGWWEPLFEKSPNWYISTDWKTTLTFWPWSILDDILIMVKQTQTVTETVVSWVYTYTIPLDAILFYPTYWITEMWLPYAYKYLTDWVHTVWWGNVWWGELISAWFNVKTFSSWISVSELNSLWFIESNLCRFKFYFFAWWFWAVNIDTFN